MAAALSPGRLAIVLLVAVSAVRLTVAAHLQLTPDEAYYWTWSLHPAAGYLDHPPLVAWLIAAGRTVLSDTALGVRAGAVVCGAATSGVLFFVARDVFESAWAGLAAVVVSVSLPLLAVGGVVLTPDTPQALAWAVALGCVWRATGGSSQREGAWWVAAGAAAGVGLLSKYVAVLFGLSALAWCLLDTRARRALRTPHPWIGALVAGLVALPVLLWNLEHDGASFAFQLDHGTRFRWGGIDTLIEYGGTQMAVVTPILFAVVAASWGWAARGRLPESLGGAEARPYRFLACFALTPWLFFAVAAVRGRVEANWPSVALLGATLAVAGVWARAASRGARRWQWAARLGTGLAAGVTILLHLHLTVGLTGGPPDRMQQKVQGWTELAHQVDALRPSEEAVVYTDAYQLASEIAFYTEGDPQRVAVWPGVSHRGSQWDLREKPPASEDALYVTWGRRSVPASLSGKYRETTGGVLVPLAGVNQRGERRTATVFTLRRRCEGEGPVC